MKPTDLQELIKLCNYYQFFKSCKWNADKILTEIKSILDDYNIPYIDDITNGE